MIWRIRQLLAKIAMLNLSSVRANRLFTRKKGLKMNRRDVLTAEKQGNNREETTAAVAASVETEAAATRVLGIDGKQTRRVKALLIFLVKYKVFLGDML